MPTSPMTRIVRGWISFGSMPALNASKCSAALFLRMASAIWLRAALLVQRNKPVVFFMSGPHFPNANLPHLPITFIRRADSGGTTFVFTSHLNAIDDRWKLDKDRKKDSKYFNTPDGPGVSKT